MEKLLASSAIDYIIPGNTCWSPKTTWRHLQDKSWRLLQDVFDITISCLPRCLQDVLENEKFLWLRKAFF